MDITTKQAVKVLVEALNDDKDYRRSWSANIAMAFQDEFDEFHKHNGVHYISNKAAERFLDMLCRDVEK